MACSSCNGINPCGCDSTIDLPYLTGDAGENGVFGGFSAEWNFDTATTSGPSDSYLNFNSATSSAVTEIYVNYNNADAVDYSAFLSTLGDSSNFGLIRLFKEYDSSTFWLGRITAISDDTTYYTLTVEYILANNSFSADDNVVLSFAESGEDGADGTDGAGSATVIDTLYDQPASSGTGAGAITAILVDADSLDTNNDCLEYRAVITRENITQADNLVFSFGNQGYAADSTEAFANIVWQDTGYQYAHVIGRIHRQDSTTAHCEMEVYMSGRTSNPGLVEYSNVLIGHYDVTVDYTENNLLQISNTITLSSDFNIDSFTVKKIEVA